MMIRRLQRSEDKEGIIIKVKVEEMGIKVKEEVRIMVNTIIVVKEEEEEAVIIIGEVKVTGEAEEAIKPMEVPEGVRPPTRVPGIQTCPRLTRASPIGRLGGLRLSVGNPSPVPGRQSLHQNETVASLRRFSIKILQIVKNFEK